ncbi:MAG TPA: hypothetical protein VGE67_07765 [Haloferula sp.]
MDLEPEQRAFVDAVMRPLGDDLPRRETLEEAIALASTLPRPQDGDDAALATRRMEQTSTGFLKRHRLVQASMTVVAIVVIWFAVAGLPALKSLRGIWEANRAYTMLGSMCCSHPGAPDLPGSRNILEDPWEEDYVMKRLPPSEAELIIGAPGESDEVRQWQQVWENHPEDAAHFWAYALAYRKMHAKWPANFVTTGEQLDPGNGWFRLMAAAESLKASIGDSPPPPRITAQERLDARTKGLPPPKRPLSSKPVRIVRDQSAFDHGWQELDAALAMPGWDDQKRRLDGIRAGVWPSASDYPSFCAGQLLTYSQPEDVTSTWLDLRSVIEAFEQAAAKADKNTLETLEVRLKSITRRTAEGSDDIMRSLIARAVARGCAKTFTKAWNRLGEPDRAKAWSDFDTSTDTKLAPTPPRITDALTENRGSNLVSRTSDVVPRRSPESALVTEAELKGGRLAEYAMYERLMLHGVTLLLAVALGFLLLVPLRNRRALGLIPSRLVDLLDGRDRLRIFAIGIALPASVYLLFTHPPGLITRRIGITEQGFFLWLAQSVAVVVAMMLGTLQATRRQLDRRGNLLALGWVGPDPGRLCFPAALLAMPLGAILPGWMTKNETLEFAGYATILGFVGFPLLWLLWQAVGSLQGSSARKLHRAVLMQATAPFVAVALAATAMTIPWVYSQEKAWTKEIRFEALTPDNTIFEPRLEREYAGWIARDLLNQMEAAK